LPDGTLDKSFANHGNIKKDQHNIAGIVLQKDYKIVTLENILTESNPDTAYFYLYRYKNDVDTLTLSAPVNAVGKTISSINIFPNPVQNTLHITGLKPNTKLSIITELGKTVAAANTSSNTYNWNIKNIPAGNYFLVASQNNKVITTVKFIKQ
jgi:type IX secretion system substrate protein